MEEQNGQQAPVQQEMQINDWDFSRSKQDIGVIAAAVIRSARRIRDEKER